MAEAIFNMKKGNEFPDSFAGAQIRYFTPDSPKSSEDWDTFLAMVKSTSKDANTAHALYVSAYNLDRQKEIKELAATKVGEGDAARTRTVEELQNEALKPEFKVSERKLRGAPDATRKASPKTEQKNEVKAIDKMISEAEAEGDTAFAEKLRARKARVEALLAQSTEATATPEAPAAAPAAGATKPKNGSKK